MGNLVTQFEYFLITGKNPSHFKKAKYSEGDYTVINGVEMNMNHPVEQLSKAEMEEYARLLSTKDPHYDYRLPTEAEWELTERAGTTTAYSYGDNPGELDEYGWHAGNSGNHTHAIALKKPNALGLYDFHGNVWERVQDSWADPNNSPATDPLVINNGSNGVLRGGSWYNSARYLRSAYRCSYSSWSRDYGVGFRLLRTPKK